LPWALWSIGIVTGLLIVLILGAVVIRYGAQTDLGRAAIVRLVNGLKIGPLGRLRVVGLHGDVFAAFKVDEVQIVDARGPWIEARAVTFVWDPGEL
ncbi:hypothetical protein ABTM34_20040, partial [Acinetobacter baumannii]